MSQATTRIISHMNRDHNLALVDYVVVYGKQPVSTFYHESVKITNVDLKTITLEYKQKASNSNKSLVIEWSDATDNENISVKEFSDIKSKLIAMAKYAANKQGFSHIQIKKVVYPHLRSVPLFLLVIGLGICSYDLKLFQSIFKNDKVFQLIAPSIPQFLWNLLEFAGKYSKQLLSFALIAHFIEICTFTIPQTAYYRVPIHQRFLWSFFHIFDGFFTILRFKSLIPK